MSLVTVSREIGGQTLSLEMGKMAKQADAAVVATYGDTVVLAAVCMEDKASPHLDFFPLTVDYRERTAAAGKFPGGFFKREGRPTEKEILTCRVIDRSIRPLFDKSMRNELQVCTTVLSADEKNDPDVIAMVASFAALVASDVPVNDVLGAIRVARLNGEFVANPTYEQTEESTMNFVVAGKQDSILMVEAGMKEEPESVVVDALEFAHKQIQEIVALVTELVEKAGKPKRELESAETDEALEQELHSAYKSRMLEVVAIADKKERENAVDALFEEALEKFSGEDEEDKQKQAKGILRDLEKKTTRGRILDEGVRSDGRGLKDIRPISSEVSLIPRTHGSALFTRGQTQSLGTVTLGTVSDQQQMDTLIGETHKRFMLHYNFPPYSVGEVRFIRGPGRREIGHGCLAERALSAVLPDEEDFPYTIRIISDILESNGSSSMASVCSGSLSMMDAGVPIKSAVAGIAMGLIKKDDRVAILSDILGQEDHMGDMDFKVAGTREGITALQMDLKIEGGVEKSLLADALEQALQGRLHILDKMDEALTGPREEISQHAPRMHTMMIDKAKIGGVIGPGGKTIRGIVEETGVKIDIEDDGKITIASTDGAAMERAVEMVNALVEDVEVGKIYAGKVTRLMNFGAFVEVLPGKEGLVHISQLDERRVEQVEDVVTEGDEVSVKVLEIDDMGRVNLSKKEAEWELAGNEPRPLPEKEKRDRGGRDRGDRGRGGRDRGGRDRGRR